MVYANSDLLSSPYAVYAEYSGDAEAEAAKME
jgi:hypothetical protein